MTLGFLSPSSTEFLSCTQSSQLFPTAESVSFSWMMGPRADADRQAQTITSRPVVEGVTAIDTNLLVQGKMKQTEFPVAASTLNSVPLRKLLTFKELNFLFF